MSAWTHRCQSAGKAAQKIVPLPPRTPCWKGLGADSEEKREPVSDIDTAMVDSLKALDTKPPIREADIAMYKADWRIGRERIWSGNIDFKDIARIWAVEIGPAGMDAGITTDQFAVVHCQAVRITGSGDKVNDFQ
jgi:hypothetical protein